MTSTSTSRLYDGDEERHRISYKCLGTRDGQPYALLDRDVTDGGAPETITIARWLALKYVVAVDNFTGDPHLQHAAPVVRIDLEGTGAEIRCPPDHSGKEWVVCTLHPPQTDQTPHGPTI